MKMNVKPWWENTDIATSAKGNIDQIVTLSLIDIALKQDKCVFDYSRSGNSSVDQEKFLQEFNELGGRLIAKSFTDKETSYNTADHIIVWDHTVLTICFDEQDWIHVKATSLDKDLIVRIKELCINSISEKTRGKAYVFISGENGPELKQLSGKAGVELKRDNYAPNVLADFDHIVSDLQTKDPCAKLIIIDGEPGTGKTYLVRGITDAVDNATFVLVPPAMIADIMSPQFIPVLMEHHSDKGPIVFIVEDADSCLVKREDNNMNSISSLLNLGDGIFGTLFDVRVVATTNARKINMDPAIMRNGRCCRYVETSTLSKEQASYIFSQLVNDKKSLLSENKSYMLADIYYAARTKNAPVENKYSSWEVAKEYRVGFGK